MSDLISFKQKKEEHIKMRMSASAYCLGIKAFKDGLSMKESPFERGSPDDAEWVDGYLDNLWVYR